MKKLILELKKDNQFDLFKNIEIATENKKYILKKR